MTCMGFKRKEPSHQTSERVRPTRAMPATEQKHDGSLVTPGSIIAKEGEHEHGEGTTLADGNIVSTVVGYVHVDNGSISVSASKLIVAPVVGDTVLCEVVKLNEKNGEAMILAIEGKPGSFNLSTSTASSLSPVLLTASCTNLRRHAPTDVCRAVIKSRTVVRLDFERDDCACSTPFAPLR